MKSARENPDSAENAALTLDNQRAAFAAQMQHLVERQPTHSPGPFEHGSEYSNHLDEILDAEGCTIALVWTRSAYVGATARPCFKDDPKGKANLCLLTAAPELLKACQDAQACLTGPASAFLANREKALLSIEAALNKTLHTITK